MKSARDSTSARRIGTRLLWLALACAMTLPLPASAQWKWRDKGGRTQYSDLPPPLGTPEQDILQRPTTGGATRASPSAAAVPTAPASAPPLVPVPATDAGLEARRRQAEQQLADKLKADEAKLAAARVENCGRAREQARTLESGQRLARIDENGERAYLSDSQRRSQIVQAREAISADCR